MKTRTFFDTETTGLMKPSPAGIDRQPYITELFMAKLDEDYKIIDEYEQRFNIPESHAGADGVMYAFGPPARFTNLPQRPRDDR